MTGLENATGSDLDCMARLAFDALRLDGETDEELRARLICRLTETSAPWWLEP